MRMRRRAFLGGAAAMALAAPAQGGEGRVLRFIPETDVTVLDPVWTTATVTRDHAYLVFDTLYGYDATINVQPQMVSGHTIDAGGTVWTLTLRDGLVFHDGARVVAADAVASIRRWAARSVFGQALIDATDEIAATDDRTIRFRLKHPFPISRALANGPVVMPARIAATDPNTQVKEMVGSGPFRFVTDERVPGARVVYAKFDKYVPRPDGVASFTAGPKIVHLDRVEWHVIPDPATAAAALQSGEAEWWGNPSYDLLPKLAAAGLLVKVLGSGGRIGCMRFNHLHPPFDNPAVRRAVLGVIDQTDFMTALAGEDRAYWKTGVGAFAVESPMASDAGLSVLTGPRDAARAKQDLAAAGYQGERIVVMSQADLPDGAAMAAVGADELQRMGFNVDLQSMDWGTLIQRRAKMDPVERGGWSVFFTNLTGTAIFDPAAHLGLRADGRAAWVGWPTSPKIEALRAAWLTTDDLARQQAVCRDIQAQMWIDVPFIPLGESYVPYAFAKRVVDIPRGFPLFYGVRVV
jgi:peptide/nickel transport system substrate-binding protein